MTELILIPTEPELRILKPLLPQSWIEQPDVVQLCGFGMVAAAARTAMLVERLQPSQVVLIGIAGTLTDALAIGQAQQFFSVAGYGIGAGTGAEFLTAGQMGWQHWDKCGDILISGAAGVHDPADSQAAQLVTVAAASAGSADVSQVRRCFPQACAEDMEGFGVALACQLANVPWKIIRGISNRAGNRDPKKWKIKEALTAAAALAAVADRSQRRVDGH